MNFITKFKLYRLKEYITISTDTSVKYIELKSNFCEGGFNKYLLFDEQIKLEIDLIYRRFKTYRLYHNTDDIAIVSAFMNDIFLVSYIKKIINILYFVNNINTDTKNYIIKDDFVYIIYNNKLSVWKTDISKNTIKSMKNNHINLENIIKGNREIYINEDIVDLNRFPYSKICELFENLYIIMENNNKEHEIINVNKKEK